MSKMGLALALMCASFTSGCDLIDQTLKIVSPDDPVNAMKANSGPYTAGSDVVAEIIQAEQPPAPEPVCEDIRFRYKIFTCDWVDTGRTYE